MTKLEFDYNPDEQCKSGAIFPDDYINIENKPSFWKNLSYYVFDLKSPSQAMDYLLYEGVATPKTFKSCPAMHGYFQRAIPVKFTSDIILETFENGTYNYRCFDNSMLIRDHGSHQVGGHLSEDFIIIKFFFNVLIRTKSNSINFSTPILYNQMPYEVVPGIIQNQKWPIDLNINTLFPKINKKYHFKTGDICAVLQVDKPITSIEHNKKLSQDWHRVAYLKLRSPLESMFKKFG